jgi:tRNA pseudouridine55 synthase
MDQVLALNKPVGISSFGLVRQVKRIMGEKKAGHAGTLDPLAGGVLVVGVGAGTKALGAEMLKDKEYVTAVRLGVTSETDDEEGRKTWRPIIHRPNKTDVEEAMNRLTGEIKQTPPVYSAIKIGGVASYKQARLGRARALGLRSVSVRKMEILNYRFPILQLRVETGPGVYIRALARDIGQILGTGGYMASLTRTRVGQYSLAQSLTLDQLIEQFRMEKTGQGHDDAVGIAPGAVNGTISH